MAGLMGHLLSLSPDDLALLAAGWDLPSGDTSLATLYREMGDPWMLSWQLERLGVVERATFSFLVECRGRASLGRLAERLPWREPQLAESLAALRRLGLVRESEADKPRGLALPDEVLAGARALLASEADSEPVPLPLSRALAGLSREALERLGQRWGLPGEVRLVRGALLERLGQLLATKKETRRVAAGLSAEVRRVLIALHQAGGCAEVGQLAQATGLSDRELRRAGREAADYFPVTEALATGKRWLTLPAGIGALAEEPVARAVSLSLVPVPGPILPAPNYALACDLLTLLAWLEAIEPPVARLPLGQQQAARLQPALLPTEEASRRLAFLLAAAQGLGLLAQGERSVRVSPRGRRWQGLEFPEQTLALYRWWLLTERWREGLRQSDRDLGGPVDLALGRLRLTQALGECRPTRWYSQRAFVEKLRAGQPLLFREAQALLSAVGTDGADLVARHWDSWDGRLARGALSLSLTWLGVVELASTPQGECLAVTPLGAWLSGRTGAARPAPAAGPACRFEEDGSVDLVAPTGPAVSTLLRFARPVGFRRYRIERQTIARAVRGGHGASAIMRLLSSLGEVPAGLAASIASWAENVHVVSVSRPVLLQTTSDKALEGLLARRRYAALSLRRLSPTAAVVGRPEALARLRDQLRRDGYYLTDDVGAGDGYNQVGGQPD